MRLQTTQKGCPDSDWKFKEVIYLWDQRNCFRFKEVPNQVEGFHEEREVGSYDRDEQYEEYQELLQ